ncbi:hypothetical protein AB0L74_29515 [Streptomyces sp. NPDC052020]|uniref:hypothetical protein n=1 Tax=Streptomyces sp. NPDC052020 TaxID=3155677 RepID=UPI00343172DB
MPAGRAIALAAMPTAVLMGMGFTPTLALADSPSPSASNSLTAEEYEACVAALEKGGKQDGPTDPAPSPSASASASASATEDAGDGQGDGGAKPAPSPSGAPGADPSASPSPSSSPDSGSDDEAGAAGRESRAGESSPSPSPSGSAAGGAAAPPDPERGGVLEDIGEAIKGVFTGGDSSPVPTPTPSPSASASGTAAPDTPDAGREPVQNPSDGAAQEEAETDGEAPASTGETAGKAPEEATEAVREALERAAAGDATASPAPSPSASASADPEDCPIATDAEGGVDNALLVPDDPWYLEASSLLLKGADYQGIVEVRTASGTTKRVLKYVISGGTDIGDLHQIVKDRGTGKTYHVQAAKGSTSTIRDGKTIMYTESISGNLLGALPVTFTPEDPPPLDIPLIYFTHVKVTQAGQFGGTLTIPGLHQYITD